MEMQKSYYVVTYRPAYLEMLQSKSADADSSALDDQASALRVIISIAQGGFGQDVIDDQRQAKERFLEYLFSADDMDLPRTAEVFDNYFILDEADELIDLDEDI